VIVRNVFKNYTPR